jgi:DNA-binding transcriptional MerR regulator
MRSAGLPIEVLIQYFELVQQGDETIDARKGILVEQREQLLARMKEMQETLDLLDYKISGYENAVLKSEIDFKFRELITERQRFRKCKHANLETTIWRSLISG